MNFSEFPRHHAILITHTDRTAYTSSLWEELHALSPAHRFFNQTVLDIDTARSIISWAQTPYNEDRVALVSFHTAGIPAQNAMLKILEEPRDGTRFVLVTTNKNNLIETVLSRVHHVHIAGEQSGYLAFADEFLSTAPLARMKLPFVIEMLSKTDEEGRKDREGIKGFMLALVDELRSNRTEARYMTETLACASYASDPSASGKALLEHLSLLLPKIK